MERKYLAVLIASVTLLALGMVGAMALGTVGAQSDAQNTADTSGASTLHVSGSGEATATPDKGVLHVTLQSEANETEAISAELASDADQLRTALDSLGVEYETTNYRISEPRFTRDEPKYQYVGRHSFEITTTDTDLVGSAIDAAAGVGAKIDSVDLTLSHSAEEQLRDTAIKAAMADARGQAETIADAENLEVSYASNVDATQRSFSPVAFDTAEMADEVAHETPETEIEVDEVSVSYDVDVVYNATTA